MRFFPASMSTTAKTALGLSAVAALGAGLVVGGQLPNPSSFSSLPWRDVKSTLGGFTTSVIDGATSAAGAVRNSAVVSSILSPQSGLVHLGAPRGGQPWAMCAGADTNFQSDEGGFLTDVSVGNPKSFAWLSKDPAGDSSVFDTIQECTLSQVPQPGRYSLSDRSFVSAPTQPTPSWFNWNPCQTGCNSALTQSDIGSAASGGVMDNLKALVKAVSSQNPTTGQISCTDPAPISRLGLRSLWNSESCATRATHFPQ